MLPHKHLHYIPLKTQKSIFVPCEHFGVLQKHTVPYEQNSKDMGDSYC